MWHILWLFGKFCDHFDIIFPVLICCTKKNSGNPVPEVKLPKKRKLPNLATLSTVYTSECLKLEESYVWLQGYPKRARSANFKYANKEPLPPTN
jgi:hypothetical protein